MELLFSVVFSLLPLLNPVTVETKDPGLAYPSSAYIYKYHLLFNNNKQLVRYANRNEDGEIGTLIRNTHITPNDLDRVVELINQKDLFRGGLNDKYSPGVGSTGARLKKRSQELMYDLDPNTPVSDEVKKSESENSTRGYSSMAYINFKGLIAGDTILLFYNTGIGTENIYEYFVMTDEVLGNGGSTELKLNMGTDKQTSSKVGVQLNFASNESRSRFDSGSITYSIEIERTVKIRKPPSQKPIRRYRAKRRD